MVPPEDVPENGNELQAAVLLLLPSIGEYDALRNGSIAYCNRRSVQWHASYDRISLQNGKSDGVSPDEVMPDISTGLTVLLAAQNTTPL